MRVALALIAFLLPPLLPEPGADHRVVVAPTDVVWIDGGWFHRGSEEEELVHAVRLCSDELRGLPGRTCTRDLFLDEWPAGRVWISAYGLDRTEVTHEAWQRCVRDGRCPPSRIAADDPRLGGARHPVTGVTWSEAAAYCAWAGGRLPTEAEWERGARGDGGRRFPWGRNYDPRLGNHGRPTGLPPGVEPDDGDGYRFTAPVGSYPDARSPFGLVDMAGNVFEWTADGYEPDSYAMPERVDPRGAPVGGVRVIRGGSYRFQGYMMRSAARARLGEGEAWPDVGLRCAYDPAR